MSIQITKTFKSNNLNLNNQNKNFFTQIILKQNNLSKQTIKFKLDHKFNNLSNSSNYIYDSVTNTKALKQPLSSIPIKSIVPLKNPTSILNIASCGILNQGSLGSCGPNSLVVACSLASNGIISNMSRLYTYFITECLDRSNPLTDNGITTQNLVRSLSKYSFCDESLFVYQPINYLMLPPLACFKNTRNITNFVYSWINQDQNMFLNLSNAFINTYNKIQLTGIIVGFYVYSSFPMYSTNGIIRLPNIKLERLLGGHCVALVGFKKINNQNYIIFQNSWGTQWGDKGLGYLPIAYLQNPALSERPIVISFGLA
jgi:hypothetical protein